MFTGIIETMATIADIQHEGSNVHFFIDSPLAGELKIDQSVAHNGVCLTVVAIADNIYKVTAVAETLAKTNLANWKTGDKLNLERALRMGDRLDGHFVQGHVDTTATCTKKETLDGSWLYVFKFPAQFAELVIEKGSVCINGVSLTVFNVGSDNCTVTIIPYTYIHTNFSEIEEDSVVNVEFDVLGKYFLRKQSLHTN
jgi:riboflavin synthase